MPFYFRLYMPNPTEPAGDPRSPSIHPDGQRSWIFIAPLAVLLLSGTLFRWPEYSPDFIMSERGQLTTVLLRGVQVMLLAVAVFWWFWKCGRSFNWRISPAAIGLGALGAVLWVLLARADVWLVDNIGLRWFIPHRDGFDPQMQFTDDFLRYAFYSLRFLILAVLVPIAEEIFLRGWLARWFDSDTDWPITPLRNISRNGLLVITAYAVLTHPEILAAIVWFNMVSWWMKRTGSLADCILIHATTNLLLGIWIVTQGRWELW